MTRAWLLVGFGITGQAVARHLRSTGLDVVALEDRLTPEHRRIAADLGVDLVSPASPTDVEAAVGEAAAVVPSPGVPPHHPVYEAAANAGVELISEVELAGRIAAAGGTPMVAVTGTNGKTTVTTLVTAMLAAAGRNAVAAGNIGTPLIEAVSKPADVFVVEVSSFQLRYTVDFRPAVAVWLNLAEDHLDWHPSMAEYAGAKARIWANQTGDDVAVVNGADPVVMAHAGGAPSRIRTFGGAGSDYRVDDGVLTGPRGALMAVDDLPRRLPHDISNGLAAWAAAEAAGAGLESVRSALAGFRGLPHRVERISESGGVTYFDDSKATTPASVVAALQGFESVVLIAGGRNKGLDLGVLRSEVDRIRAVVAIGEAAPAVEAVFAGVRPVKTAASMDDAIRAARQLARPGDVVLLSPGCASYDWYRSYGERGDDFQRGVHAVVGCA